MLKLGETDLDIAPQFFPCKPIVTTKNDRERLQKAVKNAFEQLQAFEGIVSSSVLSLYQRAAQIGEITSDHERWAETLKIQHKLFEDALNGVKADIGYASELDSPQEIKKALQGISFLEVSSRPIIKIYDELLIVLTSPTHQDALETYKVKKRECRDKIKLGSRDKTLNSLTAIFHALEEKIKLGLRELGSKPVIEVHETVRLYLDTLQYLKYTAKNIPPDAPPPAPSWWSWRPWHVVAAPPPPVLVSDAELASRVTDLTAHIEKLEQSLAPLHPLKRPIDTSNPGEVDQHLALCPNGNPSDDVDFRRIEFPYAEIMTQVGDLRTVAKGLVLLNDTIQAQLKTLYKGREKVRKDHSEQASRLQRLLDGLAARIYLQQDSLLTLPQTKYIHAGMYFVAHLLAKTRHVQFYLDHFKNLSSNSCMPCTRALNRTISYLVICGGANQQQAHPLTSEKAIKRLYSALQTASAFVKPHAETIFRDRLRTLLHDMIYDVLGKLGTKTISMSEAERDIPSKILARAPIESFENRALFIYMVKGFINKLFFLADAFDPRFEITLTILMRDPRYEEHTRNLLEKSKGFNTLFLAYGAASDFFQNSEKLLLMGQALDMLARIGGTLDTLNRYCRVQKIIQDFKRENPVKQNKVRLDWLVEATKPQLESLKAREAYPDALETLDDPENILYKLLLENAPDDAIIPHIPPALPNQRILRLLVYKWALERLMSGKGLHEKTLSLLFFEYLNNPNVQKLWIEQYGLCYMELALYRCSESVGGKMPPLFHDVNSKRGLADYQLLVNILNIYSQFRTKKGQERTECVNQADAELARYAQSAITPNVAIARACFEEMQSKA